MKNFQDNGTYLFAFTHLVRVLCPRCSTAGVVISNHQAKQPPRFTCSGCSLRLEGYNSHWYAPSDGIAACRCYHCGRRLQKKINHQGELPKTTALRCPGCNSVTEGKNSWFHDVGSTPYEPAFGLALELQTEVVRNTLWAYNVEHLDFLKNYVSAKVRERNPNANGSLASRLPSWIKSAKNRMELIKAIERLQTRAGA